MARVADRIQESTLTEGLGNIVLGGAMTGFRPFSAEFADGEEVYYTIANGAQWETGIGSYVVSTNSIARNTVHKSSGGTGVKVALTAGPKAIYTSISEDLINVLLERPISMAIALG